MYLSYFLDKKKYFFLKTKLIFIRKNIIFFLGVVFFCIYVIKPIEGWGSDTLLILSKISFFLSAIMVVFTKSKKNILLNGLLLVPMTSSIFIAFPSSIATVNDYYDYSNLSEIEYKLKYGIIAVLPSLIVIALYCCRKKRVQDISRLFVFSQETYYPGVYGKQFSLLFLFVMAIFIYSNVVGDLPIVSYFSRVFFLAFQWFFFWVGFWNTRMGKSLWVLNLTFLIIYSSVVLISGGRYSAIILLFILGLGYYLDKNKKTRQLLKLNLMWVIPFVGLIVGVLGLVRQEIGRGGISIVVEENRIGIFLNAVYRSIDQFFVDDAFREKVFDATTSRVKGAEALSRVIQLSPDVIPYRGFANLDDEISAIFRIAALQKGFSMKDINDYRTEMVEKNLGNSAANSYGFYVTATNSVEWPIYADAYSRGGFIIVILYLLIVIFWFNFIDAFIRKNITSNIEYLIFATVMVRLLSNIGSVPLHSTIRSSIVIGAFAFAVLKLINFLNRFKYAKKL